jgi:hypothetical protein
MIVALLGAALVVIGCVTMKRIEQNTRLLEKHTKELLEKARKFDELYTRLSTAIGSA